MNAKQTIDKPIVSVQLNREVIPTRIETYAAATAAGAAATKNDHDAPAKGRTRRL